MQEDGWAGRLVGRRVGKWVGGMCKRTSCASGTCKALCASACAYLFVFSEGADGSVRYAVPRFRRKYLVAVTI